MHLKRFAADARRLLWLYRRVVFGELTKDELKDILDLNRREIMVFAPMVLMVMVLGIYPEPFLEVIRVSVANLIFQAGGIPDGIQAAALVVE